MFVGIKKNVVYLARREKMQLGEFFFGRVIQVNGRFVQGIEIRLQLLIIDFAEFGDGIVDVQYDFV